MLEMCACMPVCVAKEWCFVEEKHIFLYKIQLYLTRLWPSKKAAAHFIYLNIYR